MIEKFCVSPCSGTHCVAVESLLLFLNAYRKYKLVGQKTTLMESRTLPVVPLKVNKTIQSFTTCEQKFRARPFISGGSGCGLVMVVEVVVEEVVVGVVEVLAKVSVVAVATVVKINYKRPLAYLSIHVICDVITTRFSFTLARTFCIRNLIKSNIPYNQVYEITKYCIQHLAILRKHMPTSINQQKIQRAFGKFDIY